MTDQVKLDGFAFYKKVQKMLETWNQVPDAKDALLLVMSKISEQNVRALTSDFFLWLLDYEFSDTILLITKEKIVFAVSPKKKQLLESMEVPQDYKGPSIEVLVRDTKQDNTPQIIEKVLSYIRGSPAKVGIYLKDQVDGDLTQATYDALDQKSIQKVEMKDFMDRVHQVKIDQEVSNMQSAAKFVRWNFENIVNEVEEIIDGEKQVKHSHIQKKIESMLEKEPSISQFSKKNPGISTSFLEFTLPVLIQSGEVFNINKFNIQSDANLLNYETVYINVCAKYKDMNAMASRTLLVNPKEDQKQAYIIANETLDQVIKNLKVGRPIKEAYIVGRNYIREKNPDLGNKVHSNFGFGIGTQFKEESLQINETNETIVKPNMCFHVRVTLNEVNPKPQRAIIAIGDTVAMTKDVAQVLTAGIQRQYNEISYQLDQDEEEEGDGEDASKDNDKKAYDQDILAQAKTDVILETRLRQKNVSQHHNEEARKKSQEQLVKKKLKELKERYDNGLIVTATKKEKVKKMENINSYQNEKQLPKDLKPGQLYVDKAHDTILIPFNGNSFAPFHISTIKNVSTTNEGQYTYLRLNFHVPGGSTLQFPQLNGPNALFVKELTLKTQNNKGSSNHLVTAFKLIKDLIKKVKVQDTEDQVRQEGAKDDEQEDLITIKGKKEILENLVIKPNIIGKKTIGNLEIHQNGVRFASTKQHVVDITFSNIKHAFFQPCADDELVTIIHFHLKKEIMIGTKKCQDVQFLKEAGIAADDIDLKAARKKFNDMDELEQEERERMQKKKLNSRFASFVKAIETVADKGGYKLDFDIPFDELQFYGCPFKSVVKVRPTKNCLIAISEFPFFVIDIEDIEVVHFERVQFGIKNFDMAVIFKDFQTCKRINSIPIEYIEEIKSYLDEIGIIYSESVVPMNWGNVLQQIREDFEGFIEDGGWAFLQDDGEDEEGEDQDDSQEEDPEFSVDSEEDEEDSESDFSDDDDDSDASSDQDSEEDLSEEGMSWDEMERQLEEEDKKVVTRRQAPAPAQNKRKPAGRR